MQFVLVVYASGTVQLLANSFVTGPRTVATMGSNDLVVGDDHLS